MNTTMPRNLRKCRRDPISEIADAANLLQLAAEAHVANQKDKAAHLIEEANKPAIREWTESIWGKSSKYAARGEFATIPAFVREFSTRMPSRSVQRQLHQRDGYYCRFCGIPLIRKEIREYLRLQYPQVKIWGTKNSDQHAALQCMWAQYDHLTPHSRGGSNMFENLVVTCAPCNYGRMQYTVEEADLQNPLDNPPKVGPWNGIEHLLRARHVA